MTKESHKQDSEVSSNKAAENVSSTQNVTAMIIPDTYWILYDSIFILNMQDPVFEKDGVIYL